MRSISTPKIRRSALPLSGSFHASPQGGAAPLRSGADPAPAPRPKAAPFGAKCKVGGAVFGAYRNFCACKFCTRKFFLGAEQVGVTLHFAPKPIPPKPFGGPLVASEGPVPTLWSSSGGSRVGSGEVGRGGHSVWQAVGRWGKLGAIHSVRVGRHRRGRIRERGWGWSVGRGPQRVGRAHGPRRIALLSTRKAPAPSLWLWPRYSSLLPSYSKPAIQEKLTPYPNPLHLPPNTLHPPRLHSRPKNLHLPNAKTPRRKIGVPSSASACVRNNGEGRRRCEVGWRGLGRGCGVWWVCLLILIPVPVSVIPM